MEYIASQTGTWSYLPVDCHLHHGYHISYAYTGDVVLVAISIEKVGVDVEKMVKRDYALLEKYSAECSQLSGTDRQRFYMMWTAKEALVKYLDLTFNALEGMVVVG
jgi:phosphopantetheinyl transferase